MKLSVQILLLSILCSGCLKSKDSDLRVYDKSETSVDGDLIELSESELLICEKQKISLYDLNGNFIKKLLDVNYNYDNSFTYSDSVFTLKGASKGSIYLMDSIGKPILLSQNRINFTRPIKSTRYKNNLAILNGDYSDNTPLEFGFFTINKGFLESALNKRLTANTFSVMQDSIVFTVQNSIKQLNFKKINDDPLEHPFDLQTKKYLCAMFCKENFLFLSDGQKMFVFESIGNQLHLLSTLR